VGQPDQNAEARARLKGEKIGVSAGEGSFWRMIGLDSQVQPLKLFHEDKALILGEQKEDDMLRHKRG